MNATAALIQTVRHLPPVKALPSFNPLRRLAPRMTDAQLAARRGYQRPAPPGKRR